MPLCHQLSLSSPASSTHDPVVWCCLLGALPQQWTFKDFCSGPILSLVYPNWYDFLFPSSWQLLYPLHFPWLILSFSAIHWLVFDLFPIFSCIYYFSTEQPYKVNEASSMWLVHNYTERVSTARWGIELKSKIPYSETLTAISYWL